MPLFRDVSLRIVLLPGPVYQDSLTSFASYFVGVYNEKFHCTPFTLKVWPGTTINYSSFYYPPLIEAQQYFVPVMSQIAPTERDYYTYLAMCTARLSKDKLYETIEQAKDEKLWYKLLPIFNIYPFAITPDWSAAV